MLVLYLEKPGAVLWQMVGDAQEGCSCLRGNRPRAPLQAKCDLCEGTGVVPKPHLRQPGHTRGEQLREFLPSHKTPAEEEQLVEATMLGDPKIRHMLHTTPSACALGVAMLSELADIPWHKKTVQVETFVTLYEWLVFKSYGRPPGEPRFSVPLAGRTIVKPADMQKILHRVEGFDANTEYVTRVQWQRPATEHFAEFIDGIGRLKSLGDPDTLRAVFWLT